MTQNERENMIDAMFDMMGWNNFDMYRQEHLNKSIGGKMTQKEMIEKEMKRFEKSCESNIKSVKSAIKNGNWKQVMWNPKKFSIHKIDFESLWDNGLSFILTFENGKKIQMLVNAQSARVNENREFYQVVTTKVLQSA